MFLFIPVLVLCYFSASQKFKIPVLLIFSLLFYIWGAGLFVLVLLGLIIVNYLLSWGIKGNKKLLIIGIAINVLVLAEYKYWTFITGLKTDWVIPLGLSFIVFTAIAYLIDVYRGTVAFNKNPLYFAFHLSFFPKISSPIERYNHIVEQMPDRSARVDRIASGIKKFIVGLGKKVLIANILGVTVDQIFLIPIESLPMATAWLGAVCFTLQLYFDFSGYTDMAIGIGRIFGFELMENFNYPYISRSIREFWRRWHITLSKWLRDYLYIPLGGNKSHVILNLIVVFLICGIWHGAAWTFVVWGLWHGLFMVIERKVKMPIILGNVYALLVIMIGWVIFRASSLEYAFGYIKAMFINGGDPVYGISAYTSTLLIVVIAAGVIGSLPVVPLVSKLSNRKGYAFVMVSILLGIFALSIMEVASGFYKPFLYGAF
jgi:alginate O-acetyltransferase complex protein AlgI